MTEISLLPGPVSLSASVRAALQQPPMYHRSAEFLSLFDAVRRQLCALAGGRDVALFPGSGTVANDVIAATLAATGVNRGLILNNGEFGKRLVGQAARFGLRPQVLTWNWGQPWDLQMIATALDDLPSGSWVWGVHYESSTGVLNDFSGLMGLARQRNVRVCIDVISSLGAEPLDLRDVFLASSTSGKALGSCSGIAMVFANPEEIVPLDQSCVPTSLDLAAAMLHAGPRFTFPSAPLHAMAAVLNEYAAQPRLRFESYTALGRYVRDELHRLGLPPLADERHASSTIATFSAPNGWDSNSFVELCRCAGFLIGGQSTYLSERRLVQIATMGAIRQQECEAFFQYLDRLLLSHPPGRVALSTVVPPPNEG